MNICRCKLADDPVQVGGWRCCKSNNDHIIKRAVLPLILPCSSKNRPLILIDVLVEPGFLRSGFMTSGDLGSIGR